MAPKRPLNLLVFAVDSMRRDHMSCYGYRRHTTPHIDRLASQGVLFEDSFSAYIPTTPAYSTMLTGRDVMAHEMVSLSPKGPLDTDMPTLPELLRDEAGYYSACVGFDGDFYRGFDVYEQYESWMSWEERPGRKAENLNEVAIPVLEKIAAGDDPFFLFLRHMDPHAPYLPPPPFDQMFYSGDPCDPAKNSMDPVFAFKPFADFHKSWMPPGCTDAEYVIAQYDGELAYMDACIARILTRLEELGKADNTLVVLLSDHGETLYDHECFFDHHGLYDPTLVVPMIMRLPGKLPAGERVRGTVLLQDLSPTILDILGYKRVARDVSMDGRTMMDLLRGKAPCRSEFYITECTWMRKRGWRTPQWKLIEALEPDFHGKPPVELYNLIEDPLENRNLVKKEPGIVNALKNRMTAWVERRMRDTGKDDPILGYELGMEKHIGSIAKAKELQAR